MYFINILKLFIGAERTGNPNLYLVAVGKMLNVFAATCHFNYVKSARLYLQMMLELPSFHPWLYNNLFSNGYHTVRRNDRYWTGLWTDLTIEQVMMRTIKSRSGLTRGRGMGESIRILWIYSMHRCSQVHESMTRFTEFQHTTSDQHVEIGKSRVQGDIEDLTKISQWFDIYAFASSL